MLKSIWKVMLAVLIFSVFHSLAASRPAQELAARQFGRRQRNAFYRLFFLGQSVLTLAALFAYIRPLPDRVFYRLKGPLALVMRLGQLSGIVYAAWSAYEVGLPGILGIRSLLSWEQKERCVPAEPEAQGPSALGESLRVSGPFRFHRHPLNFSPLPVFWLNPVMTAKLLAFNLVASLYLLLGSVHEETRLLAAYGDRYRDYQESGIPFFFPKFS